MKLCLPYKGKKNRASGGGILKKVLYTDFVKTESLIEELLGKKEIKKAITNARGRSYGNRM